MRIAIVCPYDLEIPGGVQQQCFELAERLRAGREDVVLLGPGRGPGWETLGNTVSIVANGSRVPFTLNPATFRRLADLTAGMDVVHVHEPFVPLAGWAGLRTGRPTVATFHADPSASVRRLYGGAARIFGRMLKGVELTAVSPVAASALRSGWGPVEIVPNAVDVASYRPEVVRVSSRVAFLGRDDPRKGLDVLIDVWPGVMEEHPGAELVVIGTERERGPTGVRFTGRVSEAEKRRLLASASIYAAPNLAGESFGIVLVEAMAAGCAVVASDLPAFRAVAPRARLLVPGDRPAWRDALVELLDDSSSVARLRGGGAEEVARFDWSEVLDRYRSVYRRAALRGQRSNV